MGKAYLKRVQAYSGMSGTIGTGMGLYVGKYSFESTLILDVDNLCFFLVQSHAVGLKQGNVHGGTI